MRDLTPGDRLDQYEVQDVVARSGMATIFRALDTIGGGAVALKVPHVQFEGDAAFCERFRREEAIGARLSHPGIVRVLPPRARSRSYLAMELVQGRSLRDWAQEGRPLEPARVLDLAQQLCGALSHLHAQGVVHRDLKPENVLVTSTGQAKLLDFGIALLQSARRITWTGRSSPLGTPDYMAPEQLQGERGDARTDVYALGTILYELLAGCLPFEAPNLAALLYAKALAAPASLQRKARHLDPAFAAAVMKAIATDPADRHASAEEFLLALQKASAAALRKESAARLRSAAARGRGSWMAAALAGVALTAAAAQRVRPAIAPPRGAAPTLLAQAAGR
jgi:serine/threonine-protein kinase